jgi:hypothetical protein
MAVFVRRLHHLCVIVACVTSAACERLGDVDEPRAAARAASGASDGPNVRALSMRLAYQRGKLEQRFEQPLILPDKRPPKTCPDAKIEDHAPDAPSRMLVVRTEDARPQAKNLLPLQLSEELRSHDFDRLEKLFLPTSGGGALRMLANVRDFETAQNELEVLSRRRYRAQFLVTDYRNPRLVYKVTKNRREWLPGVIAARLVIFELDSERAICESLLVAVNDTRQAPTTFRSQENTRNRLVKMLAHLLQEQAVIALSRMTSTLRYPETWPARASDQQPAGIASAVFQSARRGPFASAQ